MAKRAHQVSFPGSQGDELAARLDLPPGKVRACVIFAHCFTCGKDIAAASRISSGLVDEGFGVLRFDFTGLGSSGGEFANTNFSSNVGDLVAAAEWLEAEHAAPSMLVGHSLGGAAVLAAAPKIPSVRAVATIGAPSDTEHVTHLFDTDDLATIEASGEAEVTLAGRKFHVKKQFLDDIASSKVTDNLRSMTAALLVMHSPVDELVDVDHARRIYMAAKHPKSFITLDDADHLLTAKADAAYAARMLATWSARYLEGSDPVTVSDPDAASTIATADAVTTSEVPDGAVIVEETHIGDFTQRVLTPSHALIADEPIGIGDDTGPNPYEYLLAGLGACTAMTIRMYARRKELPLDHVRVTLSHERTRREDCNPDGSPCRVSEIKRTIEFEGDLSDAQTARLLEIADKCPVHLTLEGKIDVITSLA